MRISILTSSGSLSSVMTWSIIEIRRLPPYVSEREDQKGKKTIEGELVPVVWPLHVDLILAQSGHCIGWASLGCEALELDELCYVDRNTQAGREQNKLHPAEGIVKRMQESSDKNKTECLLDATGWQLYSYRMTCISPLISPPPCRLNMLWSCAAIDKNII